MMEPPLTGMTVSPQGEPYMIDAWACFMKFGLSQKDFIEGFRKDTGHNLNHLLNRSELDKLIDASVGLENTMMAAWCDWLTKNHWGIE